MTGHTPPQLNEVWDIGSCKSVVFVGVGRTFEEEKFLVFEKEEGGFLLIRNDEFYSKDFPKKKCLK